MIINQKFEVILYEKADGSCPVTDFIRSLIPNKKRELPFDSSSVRYWYEY